MLNHVMGIFFLAELLSAYNRPGAYGGSLENRTRLLRNGIKAAKVYEDEQFLVTARIGIYDGFAYPYGFGVKEGEGSYLYLEVSGGISEKTFRRIASFYD